MIHCPHNIVFQIGLMRGGKFLAEESPDNLLMQHQCNTLEEVFLKLAILQNKGKRRRSSIVQEISGQIVKSVTMTVSLIYLLRCHKKNFFSRKKYDVRSSEYCWLILLLFRQSSNFKLV